MRTDDLVPSLRRGVYISPSKQRLSFNFSGQPEFTQSKKLSIQEVPLSSSWVVQDLGVGMLTFSIEMVFSGPSADADCQKMIDALSETGSGMLLHPCGQDILCIPTGWTYQPCSLSKVWMAVLAVNFVKTIKQPYPAIQQDFEGDIELAKKELLSPALNLAERIEKFTQNDLINARRTIEDITNKIITPLRWLADTTTATGGLLFQAELELKNLLALDAPLIHTLQSLGNMVSIPARAKLDLSSKKQAYIDALKVISVTNTPDDTIKEAMRWQTLQQLAMSACTAFENAEIASAEIAAEFVKSNTENYKYLLANSILEPDSLDQVLRMMNLSNAAMNAKLFTLPKRISKILEQDTSIISAAYDMSGNTDSLEKFISYNNLTADELLLMRRGKEVHWYG